ncbi:MAG: hypothetical protein ABJA64_03085 [Candidatus Saccharibacteria bacterium]
MKDLDFDELDRAVNSLMSDTDAPNLPVVDSPASVATVQPPVIGAQPADLPVEAVASPESRENASLATRRSGRFMDVVHPSSDMKTSDMTPVSRQGVTIPARSLDTMSPNAQLPESTPPASAVSQNTSSETTNWPDPLNVSPSSDAETPSAASPVEPSQPLSSPFLQDTKVEKRPLGGQTVDAAIAAELAKESPDAPALSQSDEVTTSSEQPKTDLDTSDQSDKSQLSTQLPPAAETAEKTPLPEELDSGLVAIESGESTGTTTAEETEGSTPESTPPEISTSSGSLVTSVTSGEVPQSTMGGSIPQQYTEQPTTSDTSHAPIYDTEEAHQALAHPAKKKSGWLFVLWILLLLIAGAGIAAAVYFFKLI